MKKKPYLEQNISNHKLDENILMKQDKKAEIKDKTPILYQK